MLPSNSGSFGFCSSFTSSTSSTEILSLASVKNSLSKSSMADPGNGILCQRDAAPPTDQYNCGECIKKRLRRDWSSRRYRQFRSAGTALRCGGNEPEPFRRLVHKREGRAQRLG